MWEAEREAADMQWNIHVLGAGGDIPDSPSLSGVEVDLDPSRGCLSACVSGRLVLELRVWGWKRISIRPGGIFVPSCEPVDQEGVGQHCDYFDLMLRPVACC